MNFFLDGESRQRLCRNLFTSMDEKGRFHLNDTDLLAYSHGTYLRLGEELGTFGFSVKKK